MFLRTSVVFRLQREQQNALDDEEQLRLGSLTMTVSCQLIHTHAQNSVEQFKFNRVPFHLTAMIIGFTSRTVYVPENNTEPGFDVWFLPIEVATLRTAEREHPMIFRVQGASSSAIVEPLGAVVNQRYDAMFGTRDNIGDPIEEFFVLEALNDTIDYRAAFIRDDVRHEDQECFTIRIFPVDVPGRRDLFACNDNYFCCQTEICIEDDDGRFATLMSQRLLWSRACLYYTREH